MSKQMIAEGTKVQVRDEDGVFTVLRQVGGGDDPLLEAYEMVNEKGEMYWINVKDMMPIVGSHFDIDWQEKYPIDCPNCQHKMQCVPTLDQKNGYLLDNRGWCSKCDAVFYSYFNPFANCMIPQLAV